MSDLSNPITRIENYLAGIAGVLGAIPNQPITRVEEYLEAIYNSVSGISEKMAENLADEYDATATYSTDDYVTYNGVLYKALADSTDPAGEWDAEGWEKVQTMTEFESGRLTLEPLEYILPEGCTDINSCVAKLGDIVFIIIDYALPPLLTSLDSRGEVLRVPAFNDKVIKTNFICGIFNNYTPESDPPKYGDDVYAKSFTCAWQLSTNKFVTSSGQSGITNGRISGAGLVKFPED